MKTPDIPFNVLVFAPFLLQEKDPWRFGPITVTRTDLDQVMGDLRLSLYISFPDNFCKLAGITLEINKFRDFHPDGIIASNPILKNVFEAREFVKDARVKGLSRDEMYNHLKEWPDLPIDIPVPKQKTAPSSSGAVDTILKMVALPGGPSAESVDVRSFESQIDSFLLQVLDQIFSHTTFRNLEAVWQGLEVLLKQGQINEDIILRIVPVSIETLAETLDQLLSTLVQDLPSLMIFDLPFDNTPRSIELLEKIASFSETLLAPSICWLAHKFLYLDSWDEIDRLPFIPHYLEKPEFAKWRNLKETSSSGWLSITCNRFLCRYPYGPDNKPHIIPFHEALNLWISPVWALGSLICQSVRKTGWPTRFDDWHDIRLEGLALHSTDGIKYLDTEFNLSDDRLDQFIRGGIVPLVSAYNKDTAFIPAGTSITGDSLGYTLLLSRITGFLFWCRDNFDRDMDPADIENNLQRSLTLFWEKTGHPLPEDLEISVSSPKPDQPPVLKFVMQPSRAILPSGEKIELHFNW
jgi:type VI secretion system protein ImpC